MDLTILGNPITKKNHPILIGGTRPRMVPSAQYQKFEKEALKQIVAPTEPISEEVEVTCIYYMKDKRRVDLTNLLEATDDILVKAGVLNDDNYNIICSHDGSRVRIDRDNPRTEISIHSYRE